MVFAALAIQQQWLPRRVVPADGQTLCYGEKISKGASKARAQLARMTESPALLERGRELITPSSAFFVPRAELVAYSRSLASRSSKLQDVCSPPSWCADGWLKGVASLQMRVFNAIRTAAKAPAAQALKPARPAHPTHPPVDTLDSVCSCHSQQCSRAKLSTGMVLQGLAVCYWPLPSTPAKREAR